MNLNVEKELAQLQRMTVCELREKFTEVFGEECRSRHKQWLVKRIIWRMQANVYGGLSERARQRALEIANDADLRLTAPRGRKPPAAPERTRTLAVKFGTDNRLPLPGTIVTRHYRGELVQVRVLDDGFEYLGERYKSLSAAAKAVTGQHWNGFHFFGLKRKGATA
jgi:hypothetical protein